MSFSDQFTAARTRILEHITAAWSPAKTAYGTTELIPRDADLPFAYLALGDGGVQVRNETPTINEAEFTLTVGGVWERPDGHGEDYCLARIEELRALIDADNHLILATVGTVTDAQVSQINWAVPTGIDPNDKRVHVVLGISILMPFER